MARQNNGVFGEERNSSSLREHVNRYVSKWPLFLICITLCVAMGVLYLRYAVPRYLSSTSILIRNTETDASKTTDIIEAAINGKRQVNINNEMLLLGSTALLERTIAKHNFNISYYSEGRILDLDVYKDAPFMLVSDRISDTTEAFTLKIKNLDARGGIIERGEKGTAITHRFVWNTPFGINGEKWVLKVKDSLAGDESTYIVKWQPVKEATTEIAEELLIKAYDTKTSVVQLSIKTENLQRGKDLLNALAAEFNYSDVEDRNKLSISTVEFIDERLLVISGELKGVEGNLENYQGSNQLVDIKGQSVQSLTNSNDVSKVIKDLAIQQGIVSMILDYFANPANSGKLVPSALGLNDATLQLLITQFNALQLRKEREAPSLAPNSTVMQDLNTQLSSLRESILESLNSISKNLKLQEGSFQQHNRQYKSFLSSIPHNERVLQEIKRKQTITEGLYLYLLQKREEAAISSTASNVAHYRQIDPASGYGPVEPNTRNTILYTTLLGFLIAFGWVYVRELLNDKISSRDDITRKVLRPILGSISHIPKKQLQSIPVLGRNIAGEQFRAIRTNLSFLLKHKHDKVILVTSSFTGEGKSFVSLNLAAVYAIPGKKVALLEFDIRKPVISSKLNISSPYGLTDFLTGEVDDLSEIVSVVPEIPGLHIYACGAVTINPADLLLTENMTRLFEALKSRYDYIIVDSPPVDLVSDAYILGKYTDLVLFVLRQQSTSKKVLDHINEIVSNKTLNNVNLILNDVKNNTDRKYYGYETETVKPSKRSKDRAVTEVI